MRFSVLMVLGRDIF